MKVSMSKDVGNCNSRDERNNGTMGQYRRVDTEYTLPSGARISTSTSEDTKVFPSKAACYDFIVAEMAKYPASRDATFNPDHNYTAIYNSWLMASGYDIYSQTIRSFAKRESREARVEYTQYIRWDTRQGLVEYQTTAGDPSKKGAHNYVCWRLFNKILKEPIKGCSKQSIQSSLVPRVQSDETPQKLTEQGDVTQESEKQQNTIITRDQAETCSEHFKALDSVVPLATSEPTHTFPTLTERWMPLGSFEVNIADTYGKVIKTYYLPEDLYKDTACAPNLIPFETFIYGRMHVELRLVTNANKFHVGKIVMSSKYDTYQADTLQLGVQSALNRSHVIVDLTANNEAVLDVPFRFHRPFVRLLKKNSSIGVRPSKYCSVYIHILSPLATGPEGPSSIGARVYYRLKECNFAGMSYRASVQMFGIEQVLSTKTSKALREVLSGAERAFDQLGATSNQDKPGTTRATVVIPHPRMNFCTGKGVTDVIPLRINPHTLTNSVAIRYPDDEPKSFYDLARIWGVFKEFEWKSENTEGTDIVSFTIDPMMRNYDKDYEGEPTPLEYACANFCFWAGTIELRFDFVSNSFHTGTIQISAEYGRTTVSNNICESSSTYVKNFHLGDQKSVSFRVPYIYDTIMRRTTANLVNPYQDAGTNDDIKKKSITIAPESKTVVKVKVINSLRPVQAATQVIKVLVFMRAGKNFSMHGLKSNSMLSFVGTAMDEFPYSYATVVGNRRKRDISTPRDERRNSWNEYDSSKLSNVHVQMDNGEKEDLDPTDNFNESKCALPAITSDCHMSFKDLLRRPCLIIEDGSFTYDGLGGWFIPLMPPQRNMHLVHVGTPPAFQLNSIWSKTIMHHTTSAITNLFRCWRGGMRYTLMIYPEKDSAYYPVYVSLIPHSGVRCMGNHQIFKDSFETMAGQGFITEVIMPRINNCMTIEVPYDTENTWTLMHEDSSVLNYSWRDKGDHNSGHLVLSSPKPFRFSAWWSAADDFELANFYGVPKCKDNGWAYRNNDQHGKVQSDFEDQEIPTTVGALCGTIRRFATPKQALRMGMACIPTVGSGLVMASVANDIDKVLDQGRDTMTTISSRVNSVGEKLEETAQNFDITLQSFKSLVDKAVESVASQLKGLVSGVAIVYDIILDIFSAWSTKSWIPVGVGIARFIGKVLVVNMNMMTTLSGFGLQIAEWIRSYFSDEIPHVQSEHPPSATIVGILLGMVGTLFGVHLDSRRSRPYMTSLFERLTTTSGVGYFTHVLRFVQNVFVSVKNLVMEALGYVSPETHALRLLGEKNVLIANFITEAQIITSEANSSILHMPSYRLRFWKTVLQAYQIQKAAALVPTNAVSGQLTRLCGDVIKMANEKFLDISSSPVRYEPFVVMISGKSRIGKSYIMETIAKALLERIGYQAPASGRVYQRIAGEKFSSGQNKQPVMTYDEYMNSRDKQRCMDFIIEFQRVKSTGLYIPEKPHLEEKKTTENPLIVFVLANESHPNLSDYARNPEAIEQRFDVMAQAERTPEFEGVDMRQVTDPEVKANNTHLQYRLFKNNKQDQLSQSVKTHNEFVEWLGAKFENWHKTELINVRRRMEMLPTFMQSSNEMRLEDPFTLFYEVDQRIRLEGPSQNAWTPFEQLDIAVTALDNVFRTQQERAVEPIIIPEVPEWDAIVNPRVVEGPWSTLCGWLMSATPIKMLVKYSIAQLEVLDNSLNPIRPMLGRCNICFEDCPIFYTCQNTHDSEEKHGMCLSCWQSQVTIGNGACAVCRCEVIVPIIEREDMARLALWRQMCLKGARGMRWFLQKVCRYYQWREDHFFLSMWGDSILNIVMLMRQLPLDVDCPELDTSFGLGLTMGRYTSIGYEFARSWPDTWNAIFQSDDEWDVPSTSTRPMVINRDRLTPSVNEDVLLTYDTGFSEDPLCFHDKLLDNMHTLRLHNDTFHCLDEATNKYVSVSFYSCEQALCPFQSPTLRKEVFTRYCERQKLMLRSLYVDFLNNPCEETRQRIPKVFRPTWMAPAERSLKLDWWEYLCDRFEQYKTLIAYSLGISTILAGLIGIYRMVSATTDIVQSGGGTVGSPGYSGPRHRQVEVRQTQRQQHFAPPRREIEETVPVQSNEVEVEIDTKEETTTPVVLDVVKGYIVRNTVKFMLVGKNDRAKIMYGIGMFNHYVLLPRHYVTAITKGVQQGATLFAEPEKQPQLKQKIHAQLSDFVLGIDSDLAYFKMPTSFPLFKNLVKFIAKDSDFDVPLSAEAEILVCPDKDHEYFTLIPIELEKIEDTRIIADVDHNTFEVKNVLVYNYSKVGACGSLVLRPNHTRPIISMHFAGTAGIGHDGKGYGVLLSQESLGPLLAQGARDVLQFEDVQYGPVEQAQFIYDDSVALGYLGSLPPDKVPFIPHTSRLVKSALHGMPGLESMCEPAILDRHDERYTHTETPLYAGVKKHGKITSNFTKRELDWAEELLWDRWYTNLKPSIMNPQVLTDEQAILGLDVEYYKPMDLDSSAGYPYVLGSRKKKKEFIEIQRDEQLKPIAVLSMDESVHRELERKRELRKQGIIPQALFIDTLKDEKRSIQKARSLGGTRVFCNGPMDEVIEDRKYFMHFIAAFMRDRYNMQHAVGINPMASEWSHITTRLLSKSPKFMTLDYSNFGPGYNAGVAERAYNIMIRWTKRTVKKPDYLTDEEYERTLRALVYKCLQSHHVCSNTVYYQVAGSPSGATFTTIINSIVNQLYVALAWINLCNDPIWKLGKSLAKEYYNSVCLYVYGDDAIMTVREAYFPYFNMSTIIKFFSKYGIAATNADKSGELRESETIYEAQFLKRGFRKHETRDEWTGPLKWDSILAATQWVWKSANLKESTQVNVNAALLQAHGHGRAKFEEFKALLSERMRQKRMPPPVEQWHEIDEMLYEGYLTDFEHFINIF